MIFWLFFRIFGVLNVDRGIFELSETKILIWLKNIAENFGNFR